MICFETSLLVGMELFTIRDEHLSFRCANGINKRKSNRTRTKYRILYCSEIHNACPGLRAYSLHPQLHSPSSHLLEPKLLIVRARLSPGSPVPTSNWLRRASTHTSETSPPNLPLRYREADVYSPSLTSNHQTNSERAQSLLS